MSDLLVLALLDILAILLAVANVSGISCLRKHGVFARFVRVDDLGTVLPAHDPRDLEGLAKEFRGGDYLSLLDQVMNWVSRCEPGPATDIHAVYAHARNGGGLLCSGMATLYSNVLRLNGIKARQVYLSRALFDRNDTHVTVEALVDGQWVIADPTFHVGFEKRGALLGAHAITQSLHDGSSTEIRPRFYGPVKYPPRLEGYYLHWLALFNNVFVPDRDPRTHGLWTRIPPFRYWWGPVMYYQRIRNLSYDHLRFQDRLYLTFVVLLPLILLGIACVIAVVFLSA